MSKVNRKKSRIGCLILVILIAFSLLAGCAKDDTAGETYRIAMVGPLTGAGAQYGQAYKNTLEILRDKVNDEGGINGRTIEIDFFDDKQDPKETLNVANRIISDGNYVAVIGSQTSTCSMAAAPVLQKAGIPMISPHASHSDFAKTGDYCFSLQMPNSYEMAKQIEWAVDYFDATKIAIIYSNDDWGAQCVATTESTAAELGVELVAAETYIAGQTKDFSPIITKMKEADPDFIYLASLYSDACLLVPQMKQLELNTQLVSSNTLHKVEFLDVVGDAAEGLYIPDPVSTIHISDEYNFIAEAYAEKVEGGIVDSYVSHSYDALAIILDALREVGDDREAIKDYIAGLKNYEGVSGTFSFNEDGATMKNIYIFHVENGEFVEDPDIVITPDS